MKKSTHQIFSGGFSLFCGIFLRLNIIGVLIVTFVGMIAGILNDIIDFRSLGLKHRNWLTHSPISPLFFILFILFWFIGEIFLPENQALLFGLILVTNLEIHVFLDSFTISGIPLLPNKIVRLNKIPFDDFKLNILFDLAGLSIGVAGIMFLSFL